MCASKLHTKIYFTALRKVFRLSQIFYKTWYTSNSTDFFNWIQLYEFFLKNIPVDFKSGFFRRREYSKVRIGDCFVIVFICLNAGIFICFNRASFMNPNLFEIFPLSRTLTTANRRLPTESCSLRARFPTAIWKSSFSTIWTLSASAASRLNLTPSV